MMDRRRFMGLVGIALFGVPGINTIAASNSIVWQGSNDPEFSNPEPVDYVSPFKETLLFISKPKHTYIRFRSTNPIARVTFACGGHMFLGYVIGRDVVLSLEGFDWKRYQRRIEEE